MAATAIHNDQGNAIHIGEEGAEGEEGEYHDALKDKALVMIGDKVSLIPIILMTLTMEELMDMRTQI